jgi:AraC-like DNA-binding protein
MIRPDRHNEIEINLLPSGSITYLIGGRRLTLGAGTFSLFWAGVPHQIVAMENPLPYYVATLPLDWFLHSELPPNFVSSILKGKVISDPNVSKDVSCRFEQWIQDMTSENPFREKAVFREIQALLLRISVTAHLPVLQETQAIDPHSNLSRADQLACYIAQHYQEPLTSEGIAKAVGLHPNYAMGLFRKAFGITITEFIIQHRITHAQRLLITTKAPVIELAHASGFQSLSSFNEVFKKNCGCTPRVFRNANQYSIGREQRRGQTLG